MGRRREVVPDNAGRQEVQSLLPVRGPRQDPRGETGSIGDQLAFMIRQIKEVEVRPPFRIYKACLLWNGLVRGHTWLKRTLQPLLIVGLVDP